MNKVSLLTFSHFLLSSPMSSSKLGTVGFRNGNLIGKPLLHSKHCFNFCATGLENISSRCLV